MEFRQHQLANGLTILAECNPDAYFGAYGIFVRAGSRDEQAEIGGVSHFLEHMVFKGTPTRSAEQVNLELDELGSSSNARTGEESTIYHAAVLPEFQTALIELLTDLMRPALRLEDFETEKKVIIEEIMMYQDQPPYGGHEQLMLEYFGGHPLGQSVLGTVESVGNLTPESMRNYFAQRYSPGNMALIAAGKVDFERLVEDAERLCGAWTPCTVQRPVAQVTPRSGFSTLHKPNSTLQYVLQLSPGPATEDEDRFAMRLLATILGDDGGSRIYWKMLDSGLAESAGIGSYEYLGAGLAMSYFCCEPKLAQENLELLNSILAEALAGVTAKELELAKQKIVAQILLASERTEARMFSVGGQWLNNQSFKTPAEIANQYRCVTLDQVNAVAKKYPLGNCRTLSIGPRTDLSPG
ncbi:MAG: M16 family metallopeptidase [Planctomycetota bacterium]|jgi:predicted Zn-dependent peptidase